MIDQVGQVGKLAHWNAACYTMSRKQASCLTQQGTAAIHNGFLIQIHKALDGCNAAPVLQVEFRLLNQSQPRSMPRSVTTTKLQGLVVVTHGPNKKSNVTRGHKITSRHACRPKLLKPMKVMMMMMMIDMTLFLNHFFRSR